MTGSPFLVLLSLATSAGCGQGLGSGFGVTPYDLIPDLMIENTSCQLTSSATLDGNSTMWVGCRARYDGMFDVETIQLMTAGTTGSYVAPAPGWGVFNLDVHSPENQTLSVSESADPSTVPVTVPSNDVSLIVLTNDGRQQLGSGTMKVGTNEVSPSGISFSATLTGASVRKPDGTHAPLAGMIKVSAAAASASPSGGSSGGGGAGCSDSGASCKTMDSNVNRWTAQCAGQSVSQAPCYCAAAATYNCFLTHGCYAEAGAPTSVTQSMLEGGKQENEASAAQLGTSCGF